jgi:hypothetical protein
LKTPESSLNHSKGDRRAGHILKENGRRAKARLKFSGAQVLGVREIANGN